MLLTIYILGPIVFMFIIIAAYNKGVSDARNQKEIQVVHTIPDEVTSIKVIHFDEVGSIISSTVYERNSRWLNGFQRVIAS